MSQNEFLEKFLGVSWKFKKCFKCVSKEISWMCDVLCKFQRCFEEVLRCFEEVLRVLQGNAKGV